MRHETPNDFIALGCQTREQRQLKRQSLKNDFKFTTPQNFLFNQTNFSFQLDVPPEHFIGFRQISMLDLLPFRLPSQDIQCYA